ncbi:MAG: IS630 transposase-related protein, partial [Leptolyngbyaceae cyanobacterium]
MPAPYDYDLRRKAVDAVHRGEKKSTVSRMFKISRNTLDLWLKRTAATGDCQANKQYQKGYGHKITDWDKFRAFAEQHGDKTQAQMAQLWGHGISQQTISVALAKIGFSRKKKTYGYRERDEAKRTEFLQRLMSKSPSQINYVDEAGTDNRDEYGYGYNPIGERFYALKNGKRTERVSWIAALKQKRLFAPLTFEG